MPVLPDNSPETQYVRQLGHKLVATIPPQYSWPFEFHVVAQKEINAFAQPGGPMFINIGTITASANEAELAGVMAHEMSHVYMQHSEAGRQGANHEYDRRNSWSRSRRDRGSKGGRNGRTAWADGNSNGGPFALPAATGG